MAFIHSSSTNYCLCNENKNVLVLLREKKNIITLTTECDGTQRKIKCHRIKINNATINLKRERKKITIKVYGFNGLNIRMTVNVTLGRHKHVNSSLLRAFFVCSSISCARGIWFHVKRMQSYWHAVQNLFMIQKKIHFKQKLHNFFIESMNLNQATMIIVNQIFTRFSFN